MNRAFRILMGISILAIVLPTLAMVMPETMSNLNPWGDDPDDSAPVVIAAAEESRHTETAEVVTAAEAGYAAPMAPPPSGTKTSEAAATDATTGAATDMTVAHHSHSSTTAAVDNKSETTSGHKDHPGTTAAHVNHPATTAGSKPSTPTTAASTPTTHSPDHGGGPVVQGTITGSTCPCTVTGTVELKGTVSLAGDITVNGGTLVARPGVTVNGNGYQIMFMNGGKADFQGSKTSTWSGNGSNANVKRDINFNDMRRIMFHEGAGKSTLRYFAINNSGTSALGDYSLHFHMNGNTTRGTLVEGVAVVGSKHHAFVPHASHGITFRDTIAKNTKCEPYWWDQPDFQSTSQVNNSTDIVYDHALADGVSNCPGDNRGWRLAAFELGAGKGNVVRNSVARNIKPSHAKDCSGFHWPELSDKQPSSWTFSNNATYGSSCNGIFVWQNDNETHIINGFGGDGIDHGAYVNRYDYRNVDVSFIEIHALGWSVTGGSADVVTVFRHTVPAGPVVLKNISIGKFVVNNGNDSGNLAGTYQLTNTGMTCAKVVYQSVVPGTKVIIDGATC